MKTFILLMILTTNDYESARLKIISSEFESLQSCQLAMKSIIAQTNKTRYLRVVSRGCYEK